MTLSTQRRGEEDTGKIYSWHRDETFADDRDGIIRDANECTAQGLRVVETFRGPTTEYATDKTGVKAVTAADRGTTAHRLGVDGAWHRSPKP